MKGFSLFLIGSLLAGPACAESITVHVKGMVCAFCAQGLTKKFKADPAVEKVQVSLESKTVQLETTKDISLSDDAIRKHVEYAGYDVTRIERK